MIGNGTGRWDVPVGGMGALTGALSDAARGSGVDVRAGAGAEVVSISTDGRAAEVACAERRHATPPRTCSPTSPRRCWRGCWAIRRRTPAPEGSQLKLNMLLSRLPRLRDPAVDPADAFAGTFHVNEGYEQLQRAYEQASRGEIPRVPPCELYCHSLTDPSILSDELRRAGAHTLTLFGLHMPARLFAGDKAAAAAAKRDAVQATLRSVDSVLAEPLEDCLWRDGAGNPCLEALTPPELERELGDARRPHLPPRPVLAVRRDARARTGPGASRPSTPTSGCAAPARGAAAASAASPGTTRLARCSPPAVPRR